MELTVQWEEKLGNAVESDKSYWGQVKEARARGWGAGMGVLGWGGQVALLKRVAFGH